MANSIESSSCGDLLSFRAGSIAKAQFQSIHFVLLYVTYIPHSPTSSFIPLSEIQGCGFSSKEETGVIKSQNWPMNYKANADCMWNIVVPVGKKINLAFTHFDVEPVDIFTSRCYDNIVVYDINSVTNAINQKLGEFVFLCFEFK